MSLEGCKFGKWSVGKRLGAGGFGEVYNATREGDSQVWAIKIAAIEAEKQSKRKKIKESQAAISLYHERTMYSVWTHSIPGIPKLAPNGSGQQDGYRYLVIEKLGDSIESLRSHPEGLISWPAVADIMVQVIPTLAALHQKGFLFVDIQDGNMMLGQRGSENEDRLYLVDFGCAERYKGFQGDGPPAVNGTPKYTSLFAHHGEKLHPRNDMQSLGLLCIDLLTSNLPWKDAQKPSVLDTLKKEAKVEDLIKGVPTPLQQYMRIVTDTEVTEKVDYDALLQLFRSHARPIRQTYSIGLSASQSDTADISETKVKAGNKRARESTVEPSENELSDIEKPAKRERKTRRKTRSISKPTDKKSTKASRTSRKTRASTKAKREAEINSDQESQTSGGIATASEAQPVLAEAKRVNRLAPRRGSTLVDGSSVAETKPKSSTPRKFVPVGKPRATSSCIRDAIRASQIEVQQKAEEVAERLSQSSRISSVSQLNNASKRRRSTRQTKEPIIEEETNSSDDSIHGDEPVRATKRRTITRKHKSSRYASSSGSELSQDTYKEDTMMTNITNSSQRSNAFPEDSGDDDSDNGSRRYLEADQVRIPSDTELSDQSELYSTEQSQCSDNESFSEDDEENQAQHNFEHEQHSAKQKSTTLQQEDKQTRNNGGYWNSALLFLADAVGI